MKSFKLNLRDAILFLILVFGLALLTSCGQDTQIASNGDILKPVIRRAVVLENNTLTYVSIRPSLDTVYKAGDTVWVNLDTHRIDDTDSTTMMAVLK